MEELLKILTTHLAQFVEAAAAIVIVIGIASLRALWSFLSTILARQMGTGVIPKEAIRISLARSLALALELTMGADILKTAVAPTWEAIGMLAAIAILRTLLNFFLERELQQSEKRQEKT